MTFPKYLHQNISNSRKDLRRFSPLALYGMDTKQFKSQRIWSYYFMCLYELVQRLQYY